MQQFTQKYTIVHLNDDMPLGHEYSMENWPSHVTLADVFSIDGDADSLLQDLSKKFTSTKPFDAKVVGDEWFGESKNIHVNIIDKTNELSTLHDEVLNALQNYDVKFNSPEYNHTGFKPHSTVQKDHQLNLGSVVTFDSLTLIDMFPDENPYRRKVLGTVYFSF